MRWSTRKRWAMSGTKQSMTTNTARPLIYAESSRNEVAGDSNCRPGERYPEESSPAPIRVAHVNPSCEEDRGTHEGPRRRSWSRGSDRRAIRAGVVASPRSVARHEMMEGSTGESAGDTFSQGREVPASACRREMNGGDHGGEKDGPWHSGTTAVRCAAITSKPTQKDVRSRSCASPAARLPVISTAHGNRNLSI